jgi:hypothetical protein
MAEVGDCRRADLELAVLGETSPRRSFSRGPGLFYCHGKGEVQALKRGLV